MIMYINKNYDEPIAINQLSRDLVRTATSPVGFIIDLTETTECSFNSSIQYLQKYMTTIIENLEIYNDISKSKILGSFNIQQGKVVSINEKIEDNLNYSVGVLIDYKV